MKFRVSNKEMPTIETYYDGQDVGISLFLNNREVKVSDDLGSRINEGLQCFKGEAIRPAIKYQIESYLTQTLQYLMCSGRLLYDSEMNEYSLEESDER